MADFLEQEAGIKAELDPGGGIGEFSVSVNGKKVSARGLLRFPSCEKVLASVREELDGR